MNQKNKMLKYLRAVAMNKSYRRGKKCNPQSGEHRKWFTSCVSGIYALTDLFIGGKTLKHTECELSTRISSPKFFFVGHSIVILFY